MAVAVKNAVFWDVKCRVLRLLVTANVIPSSPIPVTPLTEAIRSSETSILTRSAWRHIPEDGILQKKRLLLFRDLLE
jgi:hypothetical protein